LRVYDQQDTLSCWYSNTERGHLPRYMRPGNAALQPSQLAACTARGEAASCAAFAADQSWHLSVSFLARAAEPEQRCKVCLSRSPRGRVQPQQGGLHPFSTVRAAANAGTNTIARP